MSELDIRQNKIKELFSTFTSTDDKWKYIIELAKNNTVIDNVDSSNKIVGCASEIYLVPDYKDNKLSFTVFSKTEGLLSLGLCRFAANLYSDLTPEEILNADYNFFSDIGFYNGLSPSRNNGFASVLKKIKNYAMVYNIIYKG